MQSRVKTYHVPFMGRTRVTLRICLRRARKGCEHFCFLGAAADLGSFLIHVEAPWVALAGKAAFVAGALGVYLIHLEEGGAH